MTKIESWNEFQNYVQNSNPNSDTECSVQTIIIDSIDILYAFCENYVNKSKLQHN